MPVTDSFDPIKRDIFMKKRLAVELYVAKSKADEIEKRTGYDLSQARRLTERCLLKNPHTHSMHGFWACVPGRRAPEPGHNRYAPVNAELAAKGLGLKGALKVLFRKHPGIENALTHYLQHRCLPGEPPVPIIDFKGVVSTFHALCRAAGVRADQWPFNTQRLGENAICVWWKRTRANYPLQTIGNQFGDAASALAALDMSMVRNTLARVVYKAYERIELDEHLIHGMFNVGIPNRKGGMTWVATSRFWVLALRDKRTGAVLASSVSYREKYDTNDVLKLIRRALMPPPRPSLELSHPEFRYAVDAAFPAELPEFTRNTWMELAWDNDQCHLSLADKGRVEDVVGCRVKFETLGIPVERESIEGLFAGFANDAERLPSGTGSHPRDPARRDPEAAAKSSGLYAHHIEEIWDVYCRNKNSQPSTKCGGLSPLQLLKELHVAGGAFVSPLGELGPNNLFKLLPRYPAKLTRRRGAFGPLRVALYGASYSSPELAFDKRLSYTANLSAAIYVEDDARTAFVVPEAYPESVFPVVVVDKDLKGFAHSLEWRRLAEAATVNAVTRGKGTGPAVMLGVVGSLGAAAQDKRPGAAYQLAGITAFMATSGTGSVEYVMSDAERTSLLETVSLPPGDGEGEGDEEAVSEEAPMPTSKPLKSNARQSDSVEAPTPALYEAPDDFEPF
jgi:hypothetical protein